MADDEISPPGTNDTSRMPAWLPRAIVWFWAGFALLWVLRGIVHSLRPLFIMLLISLFLSFAIEPAVNRLERGGMRRGAGTGLVFLAIIVALGAFGYAMGRALSDQVSEFVDDAPGYIEDAERWFNDHGIEVNFDDLQEQFIEGGDAQEFAQNLASRAVDIGATVANTIFQIFTIGLFTFYLVAEGPKLRRNVCSVLRPERQREVLRVWDLAIEKTGGYIASRAVLGIISGGAHSLAFVAIGLPSPLPLGLWVGFMSQFIPVVGTYLAGALPLLIAIIDKPITGLWTLIFLVIYQQIENYIFLPRVTAHTMEIHVASAFGSVIVGAAILGPVGALLALPAAATMQAFISSYVNRHEVDEYALARVTSKRKRGRRAPPRPKPG
ncbi:MAG TPA: AI-2E family transporter [Acidimicrobiales bacterium]|nr:AI-2E family transporter [Acidimicrobiales bacterium]